MEITLPQGHESLGPLGNRTRHCFGWFTGRTRADDGVDVDGLTGWAEEVHSAWTAKDPIQ